MARRRITKGALATAFGAFLITALLILQGACALADHPWPPPPSGQDPNRYEGYCRSQSLPDDYDPAGADAWQLSGERDPALFFDLPALFSRGAFQAELEGVMGAGVEKAWGITTGRPDVLIAVLDTGIDWRDAAGMAELARKFYLNEGEIPPPLGAASWDANGDGVFNVDDYAGDPRVTDVNANGFIDPQDIIWTFADGEDDDGNGYVDDISGWDFVEDDNDPWDETGAGSGTAQCRWAAGEADNAAGTPGACPNAAVMAVRVAYSATMDLNDFAQGVIFAVDSGACVVQGALSSPNNTPLGQAAVDYAWSRGAALIASAGEGGSARHDYPGNYEHALQVNSVTSSREIGGPSLDQFPTSYLYLGGLSDHGTHTLVSCPSEGSAAGAVGRASGMAGLLYSAALDGVKRGETWNYPGLDKPLSAGEVKQLLSMTADDIDLSPCSRGSTFGYLDGLIGPSQRFPSGAGWDIYSGYGRVNAYEAVRAVSEGRIPPEADISSPRWYELINPGRATLDVVGRVAAVRADYFRYSVEWGAGADPGEGEWVSVREAGPEYEAVEGVLATLDLGQIYRAVQDSIEERGGVENPDRFTFTVRVRVRDNLGSWGEDRKAAFCFHDPDAYPGTPLYLGADVSASPRFADLDNDGSNELIIATGDGLIHAYDREFNELEGWPVHTAPLSLHVDSQAFRSGAVPAQAYGSISGTPAVGDLDHDGDLEVVAGDSEGRVYAWDAAGRLLPGFPVRSNPLYSVPDRMDWWTEGVLPADWFAARFVPDKLHRLNAWNRLDKAFPSGPVLCNLDGSLDGSLEIVAACADQHVYAWRLDGEALRGWPVRLVDPAMVTGFDPVTHTCDFDGREGIAMGGPGAACPSVADLDGDLRPEVICASAEVYAEDPAVSWDGFAPASFLPALEALAGGDAGRFSAAGNGRVYALYGDGAAHGLQADQATAADQAPANAFLAGWPVKAATASIRISRGAAAVIGGPAAVADVDGDKAMEVGISVAGGPALLLEPDGTSHLGTGGDGLPPSLNANALGAVSDSADGPILSSQGGGCFAYLGEYGISYVAPTLGVGRVMDALLPADQIRSDDAVTAWSATDGSILPAFPRVLNDGMCPNTPAVADIDGDGRQEVLAASSFRDFHAVDTAGSESAGWPRFTGGWSATTPAVADFDGDAKREVAVGTREGWLLVWRTASSTSHAADWPEYGHDPCGTGWLDADAVRPGMITDLGAELIRDGETPRGVRLTWTAPGDDGHTGQALCYDVRCLDRPLDADNWGEAAFLEGKPLPAAAGSAQEYVVEGAPLGGDAAGRTYYFAVQTRDEAGNLSALSNVVCVSF